MQLSTTKSHFISFFHMHQTEILARRCTNECSRRILPSFWLPKFAWRWVCLFEYFNSSCHYPDYIHSKGILHRDVKPENLLVKEDYHIMLSDFGSSIQMNEMNQVNTPNTVRKCSFVGSHLYVCPEVSGCSSKNFVAGYVIAGPQQRDD